MTQIEALLKLYELQLVESTKLLLEGRDTSKLDGRINTTYEVLLQATLKLPIEGRITNPASERPPVPDLNIGGAETQVPLPKVEEMDEGKKYLNG